MNTMKKTIQELTKTLTIKQSIGDLLVVVSGIEIDSRKIREGALFIAISGVQSDGHLFITKAINAGAIAIVCEILPTDLVGGITYLVVANTQEAAALMATVFFNNPSAKLSLV